MSPILLNLVFTTQFILCMYEKELYFGMNTRTLGLFNKFGFGAKRQRGKNIIFLESEDVINSRKNILLILKTLY